MITWWAISNTTAAFKNPMHDVWIRVRASSTNFCSARDARVNADKYTMRIKVRKAKTNQCTELRHVVHINTAGQQGNALEAP